MRIQSVVAAAAILATSLITHADTLSTFDLNATTVSGGSANGTVTLDATIGLFTSADITVISQGGQFLFNGVPLASPGYGTVWKDTLNNQFILSPPSQLSHWLHWRRTLLSPPKLRKLYGFTPLRILREYGWSVKLRCSPSGHLDSRPLSPDPRALIDSPPGHRPARSHPPHPPATAGFGLVGYYSNLSAIETSAALSSSRNRRDLRR